MFSGRCSVAELHEKIDNTLCTSKQYICSYSEKLSIAQRMEIGLVIAVRLPGDSRQQRVQEDTAPSQEISEPIIPRQKP